MKKQLFLIYDLDFTVVDSTIRATKYINIEAKFAGDLLNFQKSLDIYSESCEYDISIPTGIKIVHGLVLAYDAIPIALTSRGNKGRVPTLEWLIKNLPWRVADNLLYMRPEHKDGCIDCICHASTEEYKEYILNKYILEEYRVCAAVDDHVGVCKMYQRNNIPAIHVLYPNIDCLTSAGENITINP